MFRKSCGFFLYALLVCLLGAVCFASSPNVVISQVYGGGGNSGAPLNQDFIELFNRSSAPVDLSGWSVQYASATGSSWTNRTNLSGIIQPGQHLLIGGGSGGNGSALPTPDIAGAINLSGSAGKVALVNSATSLTGTCPTGAAVIDFVGFGSSANCSEGSAPTATLSNSTAAIRKLNGCTDTDTNSADFDVSAPAPRNSSSPFTTCAASIPPAGRGTVNPASVDPGESTLVTFAVTPGANPKSATLSATVDLSPINGSAAQQLYDDGTNGDAVAGDNVFSSLVTVDSSAAFGAKVLTATITDDQKRSSTASVTLTVLRPLPVLAIHDIQGSGDSSRYVDQAVSAIGIVTAIKSNSFFMQAADNEIDGDPATSEGINVFTGSTPTVHVGDRVKVSGTIAEYQPTGSPLSLTEFGSSQLAIKPISSNNPLPTPVHLTAADLAPEGSIDQLERFEGMRVVFDSLTATGPTGGSVDESSATSTSNGVFFTVITGTPRPFREPGVQAGTVLPAEAPANIPVFDGNPELLRVDSDAQTGAVRLDVSSGAVLTGSNSTVGLTGVLDYAYNVYTFEPDPGSAVVTGGAVATPVSESGEREFTAAAFNMQHFFNDKTDGTATGTPTPTAYAKRLAKASLAIRAYMHAPDLIGVEEIENISTLQDIANQVNADAVAAGLADPQYQAYLFEGNDMGGIDVGVLAKGARVTVTSATQVGKGATFIDPSDLSVDTLNDRPPLVVTATIKPPVGQPYPVTFIVNHLRSLLDVEDTGATGQRVRAKRAAEAEFLAELIGQHQAAGEHVISVGDYNAFEFNDGYVDVIGAILGTPVPIDQVVTPTAEYITPHLLDLVTTVPAGNRYSYVENGSAQVLDHIIVTQDDLISRPTHIEFARIDADFPESLRGNGTRAERVSDHDPVVAFFTFPPPKADLTLTATTSPTVLSGQSAAFNFTVSNNGPDAADNVVFTHALPSGVAYQNVTSAAPFTCSVANSTVTCTATSLAPQSSAQINVTGLVACHTADATPVAATASVTSTTLDSNTTDNTATVSATVLNPPPTLTPITATLRPGKLNRDMVVYELAYSIGDNCDASFHPQVTMTSDRQGQNDSRVNFAVIDPTHITIRANGGGNGLAGPVYNVTVSVADSFGYTSTQSVAITPKQ